MTSAPGAAGWGPRTAPERLLLGLLFAQLVPVVLLFPTYALARQDAWGLRVFAVALAALGLAAFAGTWRRAPWALWAVVVLVALKIVVDAFAYALGLPEEVRSADAFSSGLALAMVFDRLILPLAATLLNAAILVISFRLAGPTGARITRGQRAFFAAVLALAAWVAVRGLLFPGHLSRTIPFEVPPLHSRFLGAMYLSGATFMALALRARWWAEVRIVVPMVALWTGLLGLVSLRFLDAFDWRRAPTWTWFVAYSAFPIVAAWLAWRQRGADRTLPFDDARSQPLPGALRALLAALGGIATTLAVALLLAPGTVAVAWPWKIGVQLAQVYGAPFLSLGLGSLMAARAGAMGEVRIPLTATLVFAATVLGASVLHRGLFDAAAPATWLWFGGFGLAALALALALGRYALARR